MALRVICILIISLHLVSGADNFMAHLNTGIKFAQNFLGSESVALKVADFVVRAFHTATSPAGKRPVQESLGGDPSSEEQSSQGWGPEVGAQEVPYGAPWRHLVRLLGLQPKRLSAVAVNALVFVAQTIASFLTGPRRPDTPRRYEHTTDWILNRNSKNLQDIIRFAKNESLATAVDKLVTEQGDPEDTSCIRLLVCKITPFVSRMQKVVFGNTDVNNLSKQNRGADVLYRHLPSKKEIMDTSDMCQKKFHKCDLNQ